MEENVDYTNLDEFEMVPHYYKEYQRLGGKHDYKKFNKSLQKFFDLTLDSYVNGEGDPRDVAYAKWVKYIRSYKQAGLYFEAVDNLTAYT
jgi:hypothetical protein